MSEHIVKQLDRIEKKVDIVVDKVSSLDATTKVQQTILDEHVRRSTMLEDQIKPIQKHVDRIEGALKFIGALALLAGMAAAVTEVLTFLRHL